MRDVHGVPQIPVVVHCPRSNVLHVNDAVQGRSSNVTGPIVPRADVVLPTAMWRRNSSKEIGIKINLDRLLED
jgi:hypothetical protein